MSCTINVDRIEMLYNKVIQVIMSSCLNADEYRESPLYKLFTALIQDEAIAFVFADCGICRGDLILKVIREMRVPYDTLNPLLFIPEAKIFDVVEMKDGDKVIDVYFKPTEVYTYCREKYLTDKQN
uniref:Uncharacterized protein n=1 Tax=viral metagenome TaxID=1070528 RepID=A0A6H2A0T7_9ZZZZ